MSNLRQLTWRAPTPATTQRAQTCPNVYLVWGRVYPQVKTMGQPQLDYDPDDETLTIEINKGNKMWVARIDGIDPKYGFDREFLSPRGRGSETVDVSPGDIIEKAWDSHGGRPKGRDYYVVTNDGLDLVSENHGAHIDDLEPEDVIEAADDRDLGLPGDDDRPEVADEPGDGLAVGDRVRGKTIDGREIEGRVAKATTVHIDGEGIANVSDLEQVDQP